MPAPQQSFRAQVPMLSAPLTGNPLDRADASRADPAALAAMADDPATRLLPIWAGKPLIALPEATLNWRSSNDCPAAGERVFLGLLDGAARFAQRIEADDEQSALAQTGATDGARFIDLRSIAKDLSSGAASIVAEAKSLLDWRAIHPRCARCGGVNEPIDGGWKLKCSSCGALHFPRTDPVVIMLATRRGADGLDRVILGRQPGWPPGLHSLLAGYVEPGESIEEAARREIQEEAGVATGDVMYLASQPWPFPSTLMLGVWAEILADELKPDLTELEACMWVTREEARTALALPAGGLASFSWGDWMGPRPDAIARTLTAAWAEGRLDGVCGPERG